jgi:Flp pilus assembly protein protease CpaA
VINVVSTFILLAGVVDDLRSRKIHNSLLVGLLLLTVLAVFTIRGFEGIGYGFMCLVLSLVLTFPLTYLRALGGGDMKLFAVFALTSDPASVMWVLLYSLVVGALMGLVRATLSGDLLTVLRSTTLVALDRANRPTGEFNIPFSVALFFGWLLHWSLKGELL